MAVRILTFNIWFSQHEMVRRMKAIGDIIMSKEPDFIALQEMTNDHWTLCKSHSAFSDYVWSVSDGQGYYTLIGSKTPFKVEPVRRPFEVSLMGRDLLFATVEKPGLPPLIFATSHLESLDHAKTRKAQIDESLKSLDSALDVVFCGDTNINEADDGEIRLPSAWQDAWTVLHPDDPGHTFDVTRNLMMASHDSWAVANSARLRPDRFWVKASNYAIVAAELIDSPIDDNLWPSDHFGLLLSLEEWRQHRGDQKKGTCIVS